MAREVRVGNRNINESMEAMQRTEDVVKRPMPKKHSKSSKMREREGTEEKTSLSREVVDVADSNRKQSQAETSV